MLHPPLAFAPIDGRQSEMALQIARGTCRFLHACGFATLSEFTLRSGRRADLIALGSDGSVHIVEIKSSVADFRADSKWPEYRAFCDKLFFAVSPTMPIDILPDDAGLIVADAYGAELLRDSPSHRLSPPTRKAVTLCFAQVAARRLQTMFDPAIRAADARR